MKIKLIALDLDGTLMAEGHRIPEENLSAIRLAQAQGMRFTICSGRIFEEAAAFTHAIRLSVPIAASGGSAVYSMPDGALLKSYDIADDALARIVPILGKYPAFCMYYVGARVCMDVHARQMFRRTDTDEGRKLKIDIVPDAGRHLLSGIKVQKIFVKAETPGALAALRSELRAAGCVRVSSSGADNIELNDLSGGKGEALRFIARRLGLSMDEVACVGDNENDLAMFEACAYAACMKNGTDSARRAADYITGRTNLEAGAAQAIAHIASL